MFKVIITMVRPDIDTNFTDGFPNPIKQYIRTEYTNTGKLISKDVTFSDDNLVKTITRIFKSQEDFTAWVNDPVIASHRQSRNLQATRTNVSITQTTELINNQSS
jgi:hypothetical protein